MQEDSPGRQNKRMRNERYNTPTKPKQLSVTTARHKAKEFAAKDDKSTRVLAKQALLKELNTQLFVKAQGIAPQNRNTGEKSGNDSGMVKEIEGKYFISVENIPEGFIMSLAANLNLGAR